MRNIVRVIVYVGIVGVGGLYRYQHPTRYGNLIARTKSNVEVISTGNSLSPVETSPLMTGVQISDTVEQTGESIIAQIVQHLSGTETKHNEDNPFGETYITITDTNKEINTSPSYRDEGTTDSSTCTTPRGRSVAGADWTLAFASDQATTDNVCVIEKRICIQGVLGGSYAQHTCYFNGQDGQYEYLGIRGSDSTTLINQVEQQLGINLDGQTNTPGDRRESSGGQGGYGKAEGVYVDDTQGVSNYALIDTERIPSGRTNNGGYSDSSNNNSELGTRELAYDLGPITVRAPETKISTQQEAKINPNGNGVQGIVNNKGNSPRLSYSTDNAKLAPTEPAPGQYTCTTPWGSQTFHNQHVIAFESSSVPQGQACKSEFRTCTYGYLRGSYTQQTCTIAGVRNTNTNDPYRNNGGYYSRGKYYNDDYDYNYYSNGRYNDDRYDDRYYKNNNYSYKSPRKANDNCLIDSYGYVGHGSTFTMYEKSEVGPNDSCRSITRMCDDGDLSGSDRYRYTRCTQISQGNVRSDPGGYRREDNRKVAPISDTVYRVKNPNSISPVPRNYRDSCYDSRLGTIDDASFIKAFKTSSVKAGQKCEYEYRNCNNGNLDGSYKYNTCTIGSSNNIKSANNSVSRYTSDDKYEDRYYVRRSDDDRYYNKYDDEYYPSRGSRYDDYDSNVRSYGTKSDPQAGSCSVANYGTLNNSDFLVMYRETNPAPGVACDSVVRTCTNGSLSGPTTHNGLRCSNVASVCGNGARESGEQCDHKDTAKSGRGSGGCSLACTPVQQITVIEEKCYDYTDTAKLCAGKNGGTVQDSCKQVRSCPTIQTTPGKVQFMAWEEINGNWMKDVCELYISGVKFSIVKCNTNDIVAPYQETYSHVIENVTPGSYQVIARAIGLYGQAGYRPQRPDPRLGDPANTFRSQCFDVKSGETSHIRSGFKAAMSTNDKTHPRWIMDPVNGQKEGYPGC